MSTPEPPTYFDPIVVSDSTMPEPDRLLYITPNGDRSIRIKASYWPGSGLPSEVAIDLTPAAIRDALNQIPGFTVSYERPKPPAPTGLGAVVRTAGGTLLVRTDLSDAPWRSSIPLRRENNRHDRTWFNDVEVSEELEAGGTILAEGVEL